MDVVVAKTGHEKSGFFREKSKKRASYWFLSPKRKCSFDKIHVILTRFGLDSIRSFHEIIEKNSIGAPCFWEKRYFFDKICAREQVLFNELTFLIKYGHESSYFLWKIGKKGHHTDFLAHICVAEELRGCVDAVRENCAKVREIGAEKRKQSWVEFLLKKEKKFHLSLPRPSGTTAPSARFTLCSGLPRHHASSKEA